MLSINTLALPEIRRLANLGKEVNALKAFIGAILDSAGYVPPDTASPPSLPTALQLPPWMSEHDRIEYLKNSATYFQRRFLYPGCVHNCKLCFSVLKQFLYIV